MKLSIRKTHAFAELKVDEIETTIFKSSEKEIQDTIANLLSVAEDLAEYLDQSISVSFYNLKDE